MSDYFDFETKKFRQYLYQIVPNLKDDIIDEICSLQQSQLKISFNEGKIQQIYESRQTSNKRKYPKNEIKSKKSKISSFEHEINHHKIVSEEENKKNQSSEKEIIDHNNYDYEYDKDKTNVNNSEKTNPYSPPLYKNHKSNSSLDTSVENNVDLRDLLNEADYSFSDEDIDKDKKHNDNQNILLQKNFGKSINFNIINLN